LAGLVSITTTIIESLSTYLIDRIRCHKNDKAYGNLPFSWKSCYCHWFVQSPFSAKKISSLLIGAGSGYGAGIARLFAQEGAKVLIADINKEGGTRVSQEMPDSISFLEMDVSRQDDWENLMTVVVSRYGRVDCLVNNAGTTYKNKVSSGSQSA